MLSSKTTADLQASLLRSRCGADGSRIGRTPREVVACPPIEAWFSRDPFPSRSKADTRCTNQQEAKGASKGATVDQSRRLTKCRAPNRRCRKPRQDGQTAPTRRMLQSAIHAIRQRCQVSPCLRAHRGAFVQLLPPWASPIARRGVCPASFSPNIQFRSEPLCEMGAALSQASLSQN